MRRAKIEASEKLARRSVAVMAMDRGGGSSDAGEVMEGMGVGRKNTIFPEFKGVLVPAAADALKQLIGAWPQT